MKRVEADHKARMTANRGVMKNVNDKSDEYLTKQFYNEFCEIVKEQLEK